MTAPGKRVQLLAAAAEIVPRRTTIDIYQEKSYFMFARPKGRRPAAPRSSGGETKGTPAEEPF
jgi:hypothetical protein